MGKLFKALGIIVGIVVVLIVAAIIIVPLVVSPNDYKDEIAASVKESTGRTLSINEDIGLSVFPWIALEIRQAELSNPEGFEKGVFAQIGEASVRVKFMPLLSSKLEMDTLILDNVNVNLIKQKDGTDNFSEWGDKEDVKDKTDSEGQGPGEADHASAVAGLTIGGVSINQLNLEFDDRQAGQKTSVNDLSLTSGAIVPGNPVSVDLTAKLSTTAPAMEAMVALSAEALVDLDAQRITLDDLKLNVDANGDGVPGGKADLALSSRIMAALDGSSADIQNLDLKTLGLHLTGQVNAKALNAEPSFSGKIKLAETDLKALLTRLGGEAPQTSDPAALTRLALGGNFAGTTKTLKLDQLDLSLDETQFNGHIHINDFNAPAVDFKLKGNRLDVDKYMVKTAAPESSGASESGSQQQEQTQPPTLPLDMMRSLVLNGELTLNWFKVNNLKAENVSLTLRAKGGKLAVEPLAADFYQGRVEQIVRLDVRKDTPVIRAISQLDKVQAEPLLIDLNGESMLTGTMNLNGDVTTRGLDAETATKNLGGKVAFKFLDGAYKGMNIGYELRRAKALIKRQPAPEKGANQTDFAEMSGSANIKAGVVNNNDLLVKAPLMRVQGDGTADLNASQMDYNLTVAIVETSKGQGGGDLADLKGLKIPVNAKGAFNDPKISVKLDKLLSEAAKQKVKAKVDEKKEELKKKAEEKIQEKLGDKLKGSVLKGLFGN